MEESFQKNGVICKYVAYGKSTWKLSLTSGLEIMTQRILRYKVWISFWLGGKNKEVQARV